MSLGWKRASFGGLALTTQLQPVPPHFLRQERAGDPAPQVLPWALLAVMLAGFAVVAPMLHYGNASGHDFEFHVNSWTEVVGQWKQGVVYPRWAEWAQYGYGEARFVFYPPASWLLGALLGVLLPWRIVPGAYIWIALTLSGCSMFLLARRWLALPHAIFAAALYTANPYYVVVVYWRSALAELLAGALLPLLMLQVLRAGDDERRAAVPLGVIVAAAWLTNIPAAVMITYSLALLLLVMAFLRRSPRILLSGVLAVGLGFGLAAFYLVPAIYEQRWVDISQVFSPGVRPQDNFLFTVMADVEHNRFNFLVSLVATAEIVVVLALATITYRRRREWARAWWLLTMWGAAATVLMFSPTFFLWMHLPKLRFVQLPWRWLLCLNVPLALLLTLAWKRWLPRMAVCIALLAVLVFCWQRVQAPWWDTALDIAELERYVSEQTGYEGTDEYLPLGADPYDAPHDARRVTLDGPGTAQIHVLQWAAESKLFTADVGQSTKIILRLFNYPAWRVQVNGQVVEAETREGTGQMVIPLAAGENRIEVEFIRTWDRTAGGIISLLTGLVLAVAVWGRDLRRLPGAKPSPSERREARIR